MSRTSTFSLICLVLLAVNFTSATSGTTFCGSNVAGDCQISCNVKNCLSSSCRSQPNGEQPSCVCGLCHTGPGKPNGPFVMSEDTGNLSS